MPTKVTLDRKEDPMLRLISDNPFQAPGNSPPQRLYPSLVGDPNDPDVVDWDDAERSGLPILRHAGEFDDAL